MAELIISADRCKSCGFCVEICPRKVLTLGTKINGKGYHYVVAEQPGQCISCMMCIQMCPDVAITMKGEQQHG